MASTDVEHGRNGIRPEESVDDDLQLQCGTQVVLGPNLAADGDHQSVGSDPLWQLQELRPSGCNPLVARQHDPHELDYDQHVHRCGH